MATQPSARSPGLDQYVLLGRSGLRVSPLCLGTMTFGTAWGWGSPKETAERLLARFLDAGGNFVDTADLYTEGASEEILGEFLRASGRRERVVLATKFGFSAAPVELPPALAARLEEASRAPLVYAYLFFAPTMRAMITGGTSVRAEPPTYRPR